MTALFPRTSTGLILFYNFMLGERGIAFPPHLVPVAHALMDKRIHNLLVVVGPGSGKALHPDTKVRTSKGWRPISRLKIGDALDHPSGTPTKVTAISHTPPDYLYRMNFGGQIIRAHENHLWKAGVSASKKHVHNTSELATTYITKPWFIPRSPEPNDLRTNISLLSCLREDTKSPSICISIDNPDGLFIIDGDLVTHNSLLLSQVYPAFEVGHDPTTTVLGLSAGEALMQGFLGSVQDWITTKEWSHAFPGVEPDYGRGWSSERGIFVTGHGAGDPDANYFVAGITSKSYTGKHARIVLGDDLHDRENSMTSEACLRVRETYYRQIPGRGDPRGARFIFAGRRWHEDDLYGHLRDTGDFTVMELPALRRGSDLYWDITTPKDLVCCFTDGSVKSTRVD